MLTCKTCPSFLGDNDEVQAAFGKPIGEAMCKRYGYPLGRPGLDNEQVLQHFALNCDSHGVKAPDVPVEIRSRVMDPDREVLAKGTTGLTCQTCLGCQNLVKPETVTQEFGWPLGLCKAKGSLVFKPLKEAKGCPWATPGAPTDDTLGLDLLDVYRPDFTVDTRLVVDRIVAQGSVQDDPATFESDVPVSDYDRSLGIRAWRKVVDHDGEVIHLPIFDPAHFTVEERALIPRTGSDEHPELFVDYADLLQTFAIDSYTLDEALALVGPPGVGKTEFGRWLAWLMQVPFRRFSFSESTDVEDLLGSPEFKEGETRFRYGRIPQAWTRPGILVFDEPNTAPDAVWQTIRPLTDNSKQLVIDMADGVPLDRHKYCFFLLAMNPSHDVRNVGTKEMAMADANRLTVVDVGLPPDAVERHIIAQRCALDGYAIPDKVLSAIMAIAGDIREMSEQGTFPDFWGIRQQIKVARKTRWYDLPTAYKRASLDFYEEEVRSNVLRSIEITVEQATKAPTPRRRNP